MKVFVNKTCCTNNNLSNILHFISKWVITSPLDGNITPFKLLCVCVCVCVCVCGVVWCGVVWCGVVWCGVVWCGVCVCVCFPLCLTLYNPRDCSLPGSPVHRIFQTRILEQVAFSFSGGSSWPRDRIHVSRFLHWQVSSLPAEPPGKPHLCYNHTKKNI